MSIFNLFFGVGPCIKIIFEYGMEPKESEIFELTPEQYLKLGEDESVDLSSKWYTWLPVKHSYESNELLVLSEEDKDNLLEAARVIERYAEKSGREFNNYIEKLDYVAGMLPPVFSR